MLHLVNRQTKQAVCAADNSVKQKLVGKQTTLLVLHNHRIKRICLCNHISNTGD
uniref:Uncharacterized protein n=1 Tax=Arundo donax TaxID=35708 RepID=A0A0A9AU84_ARUDO